MMFHCMMKGEKQQFSSDSNRQTRLLQMYSDQAELSYVKNAWFCWQFCPQPLEVSLGQVWS